MNRDIDMSLVREEEYYKKKFNVYIEKLQSNFPNENLQEKDIETIQTKMTKFYHRMIKKMLEEATSSTPPCNFGWFGLDSFCRGEVLPYSDIDLICLVENDDVKTWKYFSNIIETIKIQIGQMNGFSPFNEVKLSLNSINGTQISSHSQGSFISGNGNFTQISTHLQGSFISGKEEFWEKYMEKLKNNCKGKLEDIVCETLLGMVVSKYKVFYPKTNVDMNLLHDLNEYASLLSSLVMLLKYHHGVKESSTTGVIEQLIKEKKWEVDLTELLRNWKKLQLMRYRSIINYHLKESSRSDISSSSSPDLILPINSLEFSYLTKICHHLAAIEAIWQGTKSEPLMFSSELLETFRKHSTALLNVDPPLMQLNVEKVQKALHIFLKEEQLQPDPVIVSILVRLGAQGNDFCSGISPMKMSTGDNIDKNLTESTQQYSCDKMTENFLNQMEKLHPHCPPTAKIKEWFKGSTQKSELEKKVSEWKTTYQKDLKELRKLRPRNYEDIIHIQARMTAGYHDILKKMFGEATLLIGDPPCTYGWFGLGSFSRGELLPYSDIDGLWLFEEDNEYNKKYFRALNELIKIQIMSVGERDGFTLEEDLPYDFEPLDSIAKDIGVMCKSPEQYREIISHLHGECIKGKKNLWDDYMQKVKQYSGEKLEDAICKILLYYEEYYWKIWKEDLNDLKEEYSSFLTYMVMLLKHYHRVDGRTTIEVIEELMKKKILSEPLGKRLQRHWKYIHFMRYTIQTYYKASKHKFQGNIFEGERDRKERKLSTDTAHTKTSPKAPPKPSTKTSKVRNYSPHQKNPDSQTTENINTSKGKSCPKVKSKSNRINTSECNALNDTDPDSQTTENINTSKGKTSPNTKSKSNRTKTSEWNALNDTDHDSQTSENSNTSFSDMSDTSVSPDSPHSSKIYQLSREEKSELRKTKRLLSEIYEHLSAINTINKDKEALTLNIYKDHSASFFKVDPPLVSLKTNDAQKRLLKYLKNPPEDTVVVKILVSLGARGNVPDSLGVTPMGHVFEWGEKNPKVARETWEILMSAEGDIEEKTSIGEEVKKSNKKDKKDTKEDEQNPKEQEEKTINNNSMTLLDRAMKDNLKETFIVLCELGAGRASNASKMLLFCENNPVKLTKGKLVDCRNHLMQQNHFLEWLFALRYIRKQSQNIPGSPPLAVSNPNAIHTRDLQDNVRCSLFDDNYNIKGENRDPFGRHKVLQFSITIDGKEYANGTNKIGVFAKFDPELPGWERAVWGLSESLWDRNAGIVPYSELFRIETEKGKIYPVLFSHEIKGDSLHNVMTNTTDENRKKLDLIDHYRWSQLFLLSVLIHPEDGKPDNYKLRSIKNWNGNLGYEIIGIDNDHSWIDAFLPGNNQIQVKCIIFCMEQMREGLDQQAVKDFLKKDPKLQIETWLEKMEKMEQFHKNLFKDDKLDENKTDVQIFFPHNGVIKLYERWARLHEGLSRKCCKDALALLIFADPLVGLAYSKVFKGKFEKGQLKGNPYERFKKIVGSSYQFSMEGNLVTKSTGTDLIRSHHLDRSQIKQGCYGPKQTSEQFKKFQLRRLDDSELTKKIENLEPWSELGSIETQELALSRFNYNVLNLQKRQDLVKNLLDQKKGISAFRHMTLKGWGINGKDLKKLLQRSIGLKKLVLEDIKIPPKFIIKILPKYGETLEILFLSGMEVDLSDLKLPALRILNLKKISSTKEVKVIAPNLEILRLIQLKNAYRLNINHGGRVRRLKIQDCPQLLRDDIFHFIKQNRALSFRQCEIESPTTIDINTLAHYFVQLCRTDSDIWNHLVTDCKLIFRTKVDADALWSLVKNFPKNVKSVQFNQTLTPHELGVLVHIPLDKSLEIEERVFTSQVVDDKPYVDWVVVLRNNVLMCQKNIDNTRQIIQGEDNIYEHLKWAMTVDVNNTEFVVGANNGFHKLTIIKKEADQIWRVKNTDESTSAPIMCMAVLGNGRVVCGFRDHYLRIWDLKLDQWCKDKDTGLSIAAVAKLNDKRVIAWAETESTVIIWNYMEDRKDIKKVKYEGEKVTAAVCVGKEVVTRTVSGGLLVWENEVLIQKLDGHKYECIARTDQEDYVVCGCTDGTVEILYVPIGTINYVLSFNPPRVSIPTPRLPNIQPPCLKAITSVSMAGEGTVVVCNPSSIVLWKSKTSTLFPSKINPRASRRVDHLSFAITLKDHCTLEFEALPPLESDTINWIKRNIPSIRMGSTRDVNIWSFSENTTDNLIQNSTDNNSTDNLFQVLCLLFAIQPNSVAWGPYESPSPIFDTQQWSSLLRFKPPLKTLRLNSLNLDFKFLIRELLKYCPDTIENLEISTWRTLIPIVGVKCMVVNPMKDNEVVCYHDKNLSVLDRKKQAIICTIKTRKTCNIKFITYCQDYVISYSPDDRTIQVWCLNNEKRENELCHVSVEGTVLGLAVFFENYVVALSSDVVSKTWKLDKGKLQECSIFREPVTCLVELPLGNEVVTGTIDGKLKVWESEQGMIKKDSCIVDGDDVKQIVNSVVIEGNFVVSSSSDVRMWDWTENLYCRVEKSKSQRIISSENWGQTRFDIVSLGNSCVLVRSETIQQVWDLSKRECLRTISYTNITCTTALKNSTGEVLLATDKEIRLFRPRVSFDFKTLRSLSPFDIIHNDNCITIKTPTVNSKAVSSCYWYLSQIFLIETDQSVKSEDDKLLGEVKEQLEAIRDWLDPRKPNLKQSATERLDKEKKREHEKMEPPPLHPFDNSKSLFSAPIDYKSRFKDFKTLLEPFFNKENVKQSIEFRLTSNPIEKAVLLDTLQHMQMMKLTKLNKTTPVPELKRDHSELCKIKEELNKKKKINSNDDILEKYQQILEKYNDPFNTINDCLKGGIVNSKHFRKKLIVSLDRLMNYLQKPVDEYKQNKDSYQELKRVLKQKELLLPMKNKWKLKGGGIEGFTVEDAFYIAHQLLAEKRFLWEKQEKTAAVLLGSVYFGSDSPKLPVRRLCLHANYQSGNTGATSQCAYRSEQEFHIYVYSVTYQAVKLVVRYANLYQSPVDLCGDLEELAKHIEQTFNNSIKYIELPEFYPYYAFTKLFIESETFTLVAAGIGSVMVAVLEPAIKKVTTLIKPRVITKFPKAKDNLQVASQNYPKGSVIIRMTEGAWKGLPYYPVKSQNKDIIEYALDGPKMINLFQKFLQEYPEPDANQYMDFLKNLIQEEVNNKKSLLICLHNKIKDTIQQFLDDDHNLHANFEDFLNWADEESLGFREEFTNFLEMCGIDLEDTLKKGVGDDFPQKVGNDLVLNIQVI